MYYCLCLLLCALTLTTAENLPPEAPVILDEEGVQVSGLIGPYNEGDSLRLICEVMGGNTLPAVTWWWKDVFVSDSFSLLDDSYTLSPDEKLVSNELRIVKLKRRDQQVIFRCQASSNNVTIPDVWTPIALKLNLKPIDVRIHPSQHPLSANKEYNFTCSTTGSQPPAIITWWKGNKQMTAPHEKMTQTTEMTTSIFSFTPSVQDNEVPFSCRAHNPAIPDSTITDGWKLEVHYPPQLTLQLGNFLKESEIKEGDDIYFECDIHANPGATVLTWYFEGEVFRTIFSGGEGISNRTLLIQKVQRANRGKYYCTATNAEGERKSNEVFLRIIHSPRVEISPQNQTVMSNGTAFFVCTADGDPNPRIEWQTNGRNLNSSPRYSIHDIPNGSLLRIDPVTEGRDDTIFTCKAENGVGEPATISSSLTVLPVEFRPHGFPQIHSQIGNKVVEKEDNVSLPCQVSGKPRPSVTWLKDSIPLSMTISHYSIVEGSLQIIGVGDDDQGSYECVAENSVGLAVSDQIMLYVKERRVPPKFSTHPAALYVVSPGSDLNLTCMAVGNPMPSIKWQKRGSTAIAQEDTGKSILSIENITSAINYTCIAASELGTIESMTMIVLESPPFIERRPQNQTVVSREVAFFFCTAEGNPRPLFQWERNSRRLSERSSARYSIHDIPNGSLLRIDPVKEARDDATFTCKAENGVGEPATASAVLTVLPEDSRPRGFPKVGSNPSAKAVLEDGNVLLPCEASGIPPPTVTWLKDMFPLNMDVSRYSIVENSLNITNVAVEDGGNYECVAENSLGVTVSRPTNLYVRAVKVPPKFLVRPDPLLEVISGSDLNMTCIAVGQPTPLVKWRTGSLEITQKLAGKNILILENLMSSANYTCIATSKLGTIESTTEILVKGAPLIELRPKNQTVISGGVAFFVCTAESDPRLQFKWKRNSKSLSQHSRRHSIHGFPNGSLLRIDPVREGLGNATYTCEPENGGGELATASAILHVLPADSRPDGFPKIDLNIGVKVVSHETETLLPCQVSGNLPLTITWLKDMLPLNTSTSRYSIVEGSLKITHVGVEDEGVYECVAENSMGSAVSDPIRLYFKVRKVPPQFSIRPDSLYEVSPGNNLNITCLAVGSPMPYVMWKKGSLEITQEVIGKSVLVLEDITSSANFSCIAASTLGSTESRTEILVKNTSLETPTTMHPTDLPPFPQDQCNNCELRYTKHYEVKNCHPVFSEEKCRCPRRFDCSNMLTTPGNICIYNNKTYKLGERIPTAELCQRCKCRRSFLGGAEMSCSPVECPSQSRFPPREGCYETYEPNKCCSVDVKCDQPKSQSQTASAEWTCELDGKIYHFGERMYPKIDPCSSCICTERWAEGIANNCRIRDCLLERKLRYLQKGCVPIYHVDKCCPTEFYCGTGNDEDKNNDSFSHSLDDCIFEGKSYSAGEVLDIKDPTNCITCTCKIPPDFTCIRKTCPGPPNDDYNNCRAVYHEKECCPSYDCLESATSVECEPLQCLNGCQEVVGRDGCSVCLCDKLLCAKPQCPAGCEVEYDVLVGSCPRCKCDPIIQLAPVKCSSMQCDQHCFEAVGPDGCLTCICGPLCSPPKCDANCSLQRDVPQGQCRGCVCPSEPDSDLVDGILYDQEIHCAPVICPPTCNETVGKFGCPTCSCDVCPQPQCEPGCEIESTPSPGRCPECTCNGNKVD